MTSKKDHSHPSSWPRLAIACAVSLAFAPHVFANVIYDNQTIVRTGGQASTSGGDLIIGNLGAANVTFNNGGGYDTQNSYIGNQAGSNGTLTVTGSSGILNNASVLFLGYSGTGTLNAFSGGRILGNYVSIGTMAGSQGTMTLAGSGTSLVSQFSTVIGDAGTGSLTVSNGALLKVNASNTSIGNSAGGTGTLTFTDAGTQGNLQTLLIGAAGTGTLNIINGAAVNAASLTTIGMTANSSGTVLVSGSGSSLASTNGIAVGFAGTGVLTVANGAHVSASNAIILGQDYGGTGTANITGSGSQITTPNALVVGRLGSGTLNISAGASLTSAGLNIANQSGSSGNASVAGAGSVLDSRTGYLVIGEQSAGSLTVSDHASVLSGFLSLGDSSGGIGSLTIQSGATLVGNSDAAIGRNSGAQGTALVTGSGSLWSTGSLLDVGRDGTGTLTIADGGTVSVLNGQPLHIGLSVGSSGTLNIGAAATDAAQAPGALTAASVIFGAGTGLINFNHTSNNYAFSLPVSGAGVLEATGGTTILTGTDTYTGGTLVNGGTLQAGSATALPAATAYTVNGGSLNLNSYNLNMSSLSGSGGNVALGTAALNVAQNSNTSYAGSISGTGSLLKTGTGTLTLGGNSSYSGGTTLNGGTLGIASSTALGTGLVTLSSGTLDLVASGLNLANPVLLNGTPVINVSSGISNTGLGGIISDGGSARKLVKTGWGTLTLGGSNTFSGGVLLNEGAINVTSSAALGTGTVAMAEFTALNFSGTGLRVPNAITLTGDPTFNVATGSTVTLTGAITDGSVAGDLVKTGAGTLILAGNSTFTGGTAVQQGLLTVDGSLNGDVTVSNGAMINGSGSTGNITINTGSTLATQSAASSIAVHGNLHFATGSAYQVALGNAGQSGNVAVSGNLVIDNGSLLTLASNGNAYALGTAYRIATYGGTEAGVFNLNANDFAYIAPTVTYDGGEIDLTLNPTATTVSSGFRRGQYNRNQNAVAGALTALYQAGGNALTSQLIQADSASASNTLSTVSGDEVTVLRQLASQNMDSAQRVINDHLYQHFYVSPASAPAGPDLWVQTDVARHTSGGNLVSGASGFQSHATTVTLGADTNVSNTFRTGLALTMANNTATFDSRSSNARSDGAMLSWYSRLRSSASSLYVSTIASYGWWQNNLSRHPATSSIASSATGQLTGNLNGDSSVNAMAFNIESGYDIPLDSQQESHITPYAGVNFGHYRQNGYSESAAPDSASGNLFALHFNHAQSTSLSTEAGIRSAQLLHIGGHTLSLQAGAGWVHSLTGTADQQQAAFETAPGNTYQISGNQAASNAVKLSTGIGWPSSARMTLFAGISGSAAGHDHSIQGTAGLSYKW